MGAQALRLLGRRADTGMQTDSAMCVKPGNGRQRGPSVAGRETADGVYRPFLSAKPVRYASVDTATRRSTALQDDTRWDREKRPASHGNPQLAGRFRRWWQVLGSNQR
jgi:hypothetical protein